MFRIKGKMLKKRQVCLFLDTMNRRLMERFRLSVAEQYSQDGGCLTRML